MRVLYVHHGSARGGAPVSLLLMAKQVQEMGHTVWVLNSRQNSEVDEMFNGAGIETVRTRLGCIHHTSLKSYRLTHFSGLFSLVKWLLGYPFGVFNLIRECLKLKPDIVHLNSFTLIPFLLPLRLFKFVTVLHVRENTAKGHFGIRTGILLKLAAKFSMLTIAICDENAESLGLNYPNLHILYNPVSFEKFNADLPKQQCRDEIGLRGDDFVVMFAGGSGAIVKGINDFVLSCAAARRQIPSLRCLILGAADWRPHEDTVQKAYDQILPICVRSAFATDIERWMAASDVICALHIRPHFSRTVIEAGAMKRTVLGYSIGGISEVLKSSEGGVLVPVNAVGELKDALVSLFQSKTRLAAYGEKGFAWTQSNCSPQEYGNRVTALYDSVLSKKSA